jgi:hypothetical protein
MAILEGPQPQRHRGVGWLVPGKDKEIGFCTGNGAEEPIILLF